MKKLTNLKGAEVLPKEKIFLLKDGSGDSRFIDRDCPWCGSNEGEHHKSDCRKLEEFLNTKGYNQCVQSLDKIGVVGRLDRTKLIELCGGVYTQDRNSRKELDVNLMISIVDAIISKQSSLIELELVVEKE